MVPYESYAQKLCWVKKSTHEYVSFDYFININADLFIILFYDIIIMHLKITFINSKD